MKKISIKFESGKIKDVLSLFHNKLKSRLDTRLEETETRSDYPDGITREVTYSESLFNLTSPYENKITVQGNSYIVIIPGKKNLDSADMEQDYTYDAISITGWQTKTPFLEVEYDPRWHDLVTIILSELIDLFGESDLSQEVQADKPTKKRKRNRGPSPDILSYCTEGLKYWLDSDTPLQTAADLAGISKETLQKWIPEVLKLTDDETRDKWIQKLKVLQKEKYLGEFREV